MSKIKYLLLAVSLGAAIPAKSHAEERLAVGATFSRIFEQGSDGQWRGLGVDVLRLLAARAGDTMQFKLYPWPRAQAMAERAEADILVGPYRSADRLKQFSFFDQALYRDRMVFYAQRGGDSLWRGDYGTLKQERLATVRGWHYGAKFDQARSALSIDEVTQLEHGMQMLAFRRVDLLAANERNSAPVIGALQLADKVVALCPAITQLDGYLAFPRAARFEAAYKRYNTLFSEMVKSGELARLGARNGVLVPLAANRSAGYDPTCPTRR